MLVAYGLIIQPSCLRLPLLLMHLPHLAADVCAGIRIDPDQLSGSRMGWYTGKRPSMVLQLCRYMTTGIAGVLAMYTTSMSAHGRASTLTFVLRSAFATSYVLINK